MAAGRAHAYDGRAEPRDETLHRVIAHGADGQPHRLLIVNLSPHGLMARTDYDLAAGETVALELPLAGGFLADIRWSLGGRIGCLLDREIAPALYPAVLKAMRG